MEIKHIAWVILAGVVILGILWMSDRRTDALMSVGECVEQKVKEDGFSGPVDQAWDTYAEVCVNEQ